MGFLHVYTGNGKGKTTAAVGLTIRAAGAGQRVAFIQFDKGYSGSSEHYNERRILRALPEVDLFCYGAERMMDDGRFRFSNCRDDFDQARQALEKLDEVLAGNEYFLVVADEAITCVSTQLYTEADLLQRVRQFRANPCCDLVLTGRGATAALCEQADLVSEVQLIKHYYYEKVPARPGIEF